VGWLSVSTPRAKLYVGVTPPLTCEEHWQQEHFRHRFRASQLVTCKGEQRLGSSEIPLPKS